MAHGEIQMVRKIQIVWMAGTKTFRYVATTQIYKLLKMVPIVKLIVIPISNVVKMITLKSQQISFISCKNEWKLCFHSYFFNTLFPGDF